MGGACKPYDHIKEFKNAEFSLPDAMFYVKNTKAFVIALTIFMSGCYF